MKYRKSIKTLIGIFSLSIVFFLNTISAQSDREILSTTFSVELVVGINGNLQVSQFNSKNIHFPPDSMIKISNPKYIKLKEGNTINGWFNFTEFASAGGLGTTRIKAEGKGVLRSLKVFDQRGRAVTCPVFCEKSIRIELQISSGDLGSGR